MTDTDTKVDTSTDNTAENTSWYSAYALPEEDVGYIKNKGWEESPVKLFESYKQLEKFQGAPPDQILKLPKEGDQEGWDKVFDRLGRPEKPEMYGELALDEDVKSFLSADRLKWADEAFHKAGLTKAQRDALAKETLAYESQQIKVAHENIQQESEIELNELKKAWGSAFDERTVLAKKAVRAFVPGDEDQKSETLNKMEEAMGTGAFLRMFANIGERMGEDRTPASGNDTRFGYSREQALSDKRTLETEMKADRKRLEQYNTGTGPDYEKMQRLMKVIATS